MKSCFLKIKVIAPLQIIALLLLTSCQAPGVSPGDRLAAAPAAPPASPPTSAAPTRSPVAVDRSNQPIAQAPMTTPGTPYPRRAFVLRDQVPANSSFDQFREQLQQAIRERDADFIQAIADPQIKLTFGPPTDFGSLNFDDPDSLAWKRLERVISIGCTPYEAPAGVEIEAYQCPHVSQAALGDPFSDVYIVGQDIHVRTEPRADSAIVDVLSNEVVQSDPSAFQHLSQQQQEEQQTLDGWQPVITPAGQQGYVSSRYAYFPAGYRARFENQNGQWKMTVFIAGD